MTLYWHPSIWFAKLSTWWYSFRLKSFPVVEDSFGRFCFWMPLYILSFLSTKAWVLTKQINDRIISYNQTGYFFVWNPWNISTIQLFIEVPLPAILTLTWQLHQREQPNRSECQSIEVLEARMRWWWSW